MDIVAGGDSGGELEDARAQSSLAGNGGSMARSSGPGAARLTETIAALDGMTAGFQLDAVGACFWQQFSEAAIAMFPQWFAICLQQARSAWFMCALGRAQAMAGATNGRSTANIRANCPIAFTARLFYTGPTSVRPVTLGQLGSAFAILRPCFT